MKPSEQGASFPGATPQGAVTGFTREVSAVVARQCTTADRWMPQPAAERREVRP